jgi:PKD repeat protein
VALTATNINGNGTKTKIGYITISNAGSLPLTEGFQGAAWPPINWVDDNKNSDSIHYTRANTCGGFGLSSSSLFFDNYYNDAGGIRDGFEMPKVNMGSVTNASLTFDVAFARYDAQYSDTLELQLSTNCGLTWTSIYMKGGTALSTAPDFTANLWVPNSTQWRKEGINITSLAAGQTNVLMKFVNHGHYGNGMYIDNVNLAYTVTAAPIANYNYPASICSGAAITFTDASTNSPTSWSWNIPGSSVPTSTLQNPTVTYTAAGVYSATLTATNISGNSVSIKTFTVNAMPTVSTGGSNAICAGTSGTITASGATTYTWQPGGMTGASVIVTPTVNTTYTVTGANGSCANANTKVLTVNPNPTVSVNSSTICTGGIATLTASGAATYSWNTGATTSGINPTPAATTVYTVTGTTGGCNNVRTATVTVAPAPTVAVNSATICAGSSANLTASGASTYSWNTGATTTSISVSPTVTTTYSVTGANGTCTNAKTSTVTVNALPSVSLSASSGTACTSATGGVTVALTGSPAGGVYSGTGVVGTTFNTQAAAGTYTATYSYTNVTTGCSRSVSTNIIVSVCTGVDEVSVLDGKITVFPNPNSGVFTIKANIEDAFDVNIYNNIGQLVKTKRSLKGDNEINLSEFARGIYNVVIKVNNDYKTVKMVIE